ncbi:hypothetical protein CHLRE_17g725950v5 [Chlamydomonas reinhardtii]|uniref:Sulfotransferase n=1 Tax=Chlamydomonas reinhardtii TaxID=3055 RepID=A0A2K3CQP8_CHLRE|nr:uncharacterized protein CHLRE_17g725950v5 [Chlamydomonas reinhardtii]XP_042914804.1 uncharacterized protein CHLRE_17g725950v5 [Chlamydomonas reinhardtii]PNW70584.1 hypothetical protein CHLRE_17g725950v5 [Chlamydomonas reinhardtii]PNW70585.1 hypothetical protein CHLRE_17g725950v5 [Chlamydomonas reinhardtii]
MNVALQPKLGSGAVASTSAAAGTAVSAAATPAGAAPATTASTGGAAQGAISATPAAALNAGTAATTSGAATAAAIKTAAVTTVASPSPSPSPSPAAAAAAAATTGSVIGYTEPTAAELGRMRKAAKVLDPELMEPVPETFEQGVKNPCWAAPDGSYRCLPYFYVTGMFHAGALSMEMKLKQHPDVLTDACTGCQFWGEEGKKMSFYLDHMKHAAQIIKAEPQTKVLMDSSPSTFAFYWAAAGKAHKGYAAAMQPCYKECLDRHYKEKITLASCMDAVCYNASLVGDKQRAKEAGIDWDSEAHNPLLVRAVYGARPPKMILLARDPIRRLYSAFMGYPHYYGKYGRNSTGFTEYVREQVGAFQNCTRKYGSRLCALMFEGLSAEQEKVYFHADQIFRGMYGLFLEIWYRFIPPQHWLVIKSEDFFTQPKPTLAKVVQFLGLSPANNTLLDKMVAAGNVNTYTTDKGPIEPEARRLLADLYRPYNSLLAKITGEPRFEEWNNQT